MPVYLPLWDYTKNELIISIIPRNMVNFSHASVAYVYSHIDFDIKHSHSGTYIFLKFFIYLLIDRLSKLALSV